MANMSIRIDDDLRDDFSAICKEKGIMGSAMIRGWMEEFVKENTLEVPKSETTGNSTEDSIILSFKIDKELNSMFDDICKKKYLSKSAMIRKMLVDFCKENNES